MLQRYLDTSNFNVAYSQIYCIPIVLRHQITHTTQITVLDILRLLDERDDDLEGTKILKKGIESPPYGQLIKNELRKVEKIRTNVWRFQCDSYIAERPLEGWEMSFNKAKMYGQVINSMVDILDPPLIIPPKWDESGGSMTCLDCINGMNAEIDKWNVQFTKEPESESDLEAKLSAIETTAYELCCTWAEPESQPEPAPYYPVAYHF